MAHKYIGDLLVLDAKVGGAVPAGQIELKVRKGHNKPFYLRMSLFHAFLEAASVAVRAGDGAIGDGFYCH